MSELRIFSDPEYAYECFHNVYYNNPDDWESIRTTENDYVIYRIYEVWSDDDDCCVYMGVMKGSEYPAEIAKTLDECERLMDENVDEDESEYEWYDDLESNCY